MGSPFVKSISSLIHLFRFTFMLFKAIRSAMEAGARGGFPTLKTPLSLALFDNCKNGAPFLSRDKILVMR